MKIITLGDSFTYGEELSDIYQAWPYRLGDMLPAEVVNLARPASSNDKIIRLALDSLVTDTDTDLYVIGWSSPGRIEFADDLGHYDIWPGYSGNLFIKDQTPWRHDLLEYLNKHHVDSEFHRNFIANVILLQSTFKAHNKKYIMLNTVQNDYYKKIDFPHRNQMYNMVDTGQFIGFNLSGMLEWTYGTKIGPGGHFLNAGHQIVAEKIYDHIRYLGWLP